MQSLAFVLATTLTTVATHTQDMVGVTQAGAIYTVDSMSGSSSVVAPGLFGQTCLARDDSGDCWTISRELLGSPTYYLTRRDTSSLDLEIIATCNDVRALANAGNGELYAIEHLPTNNILSRIQTATGARTFLGFTGQDIRGMTMHQGLLYAHSTTLGLGTLDQGLMAY